MQADTQLWMGDLDPRWSETDIVAIWTELGERPVNVKIMRDKSGRSQYCFVTFPNPSIANAAIQRNRTHVPGSSRTFKLNKASGGGVSMDSGRQHSPLPNQNQGPGRQQADYSVFVGDLAQEVTEQMLFKRFNQQYPGVVKQVKIMTDMNTGASKGFGFVRFHQVDAQQLALTEMNGVIIGDRAIRVGLANGSLEQTPGVKRGAESSPATKLPQHQPALSPSSDPYNSTIAIKGINASVVKEDIVAHFGPYGTLVYVKRDENAQIAHVKYLLRECAEKALLSMNGIPINGCRVSLRWGREEKNEKSRTKVTPVTKYEKNAKYHASEKPPAVYGELKEYCVLEDLSEEALNKLEFREQTEYCSVEDTDKCLETRYLERTEYLELAL